MGSRGSNPGMQIHGNFQVTNNTEKNVMLTGAIMKKKHIKGQVLTKNIKGQEYSAEYQIPPNCTIKISINFWVEPPFKKKGYGFVSDIAILDNYGKKYWICKVKFKYI